MAATVPATAEKTAPARLPAPAEDAVAPLAATPTKPAPRAARPAATAAPRRPVAAAARRPLVQPLRRVARHQASRPRPADEGRRPHDTWHIVLGSVLIVGSVVVGLLLGGWLGLGVGAAIMLLGDYFLVLGIGGKHAWQEIFQEFFNM